MQALFANVVNTSGTGEEIALFFGTNDTWIPVAGSNIHVSLNQRVILSPHATKCLSALLNTACRRAE
jgi:hypothetical protein